MKRTTTLFFINFFVFTFAFEMEETERKKYPYDYVKYKTCGEKANSTCFPSSELYKNVPANEQEFRTYCKLHIPYVKCYDEDFSNCLGFNPYQHEIAFILATHEKACDENSEWHKAISKHLPCAEREITSYSDTCPEKIDEIAKAVTKVLGVDWDKVENFKYNRSSEDEKDMVSSYWCFKNALMLSCLQMKIENCGTEAANLSLEIIKSLSYSIGACNEDLTGHYYTAVGNSGLKDQEVKTIRNILKIWFENSVLLRKHLNEE